MNDDFLYFSETRDCDSGAGASRCNQHSYGKDGDAELRFIFLLASCACGFTG